MARQLSLAPIAITLLAITGQLLSVQAKAFFLNEERRKARIENSCVKVFKIDF
jgi:hypothetical protein